ncbi:MAG: XdhC family protein [Acidobacteria bacterium]|nr:XdhC family protein [Acidobacteriota bacterium]
MSMRERRDIVHLQEEGAGALITLVRATGSTYRRPGARLAIASDGRFAGTISGGCLEADLLRKATWKVRDGAVMEHFSTAFDDTTEIPYGLGCGGEVDLLLEPAGTPEHAALLEAMRASLDGEQMLVATMLPEEKSTFGRIVVNERGDVLFASDWIATDDIVDLRAYLRQKFASPESVFAEAYRTFFFERLEPPQRLFIFGAGEDARPLVHLASEVGWHVIVADRRAHHARPERFPEATRVIAHAEIASLGCNARDAVVLMTHSYEEDRRLLAEMLHLQPRYLGLLGARHRSSLLLSEASSAANLLLHEACARLHAPVGLDLGGDGPHAVALSIVAEIQAALHDRAAANRGMTEAEVEAQLREKENTTYSHACAMDNEL